MNIRYLRYFTTLVEEQSFTKAAEKLCIAQPPLSRQIKNLEEELGVDLIDRTSRPLRPTPAGEVLYSHALLILEKIAETKKLTKNLPKNSGVIKIGFVVSLLYGLLPKIIATYRNIYPNIKIELLEMSSIEQLEALKNGEIHIGFGRILASDPAVRRDILREEKLSIVINNQHPFKKNRKKIYLADLVEEKVILYPNHSFPNLSTEISNIFTNHNLKLKEVELVRDIQLAIGLVAANEGICIVPASAAKVSIDNVTYLPIQDALAKSLIISSIRQEEKDPKVLKVFSCVQEVYKKEGLLKDTQTMEEVIAQLS